MNHLVQLLLPLNDNHKRPYPPELHASVRSELMQKFGGLTAYARSPAEGLWKDSEGPVQDVIVVYEVMVDQLDTEWWARYRAALEKRFLQEEVVIRALPMKRL